jgi:hypothetical protein
MYNAESHAKPSPSLFDESYEPVAVDPATFGVDPRQEAALADLGKGQEAEPSNRPSPTSYISEGIRPWDFLLRSPGTASTYGSPG